MHFRKLRFLSLPLSNSEFSPTRSHSFPSSFSIYFTTMLMKLPERRTETSSGNLVENTIDYATEYSASCYLHYPNVCKCLITPVRFHWQQDLAVTVAFSKTYQRTASRRIEAVVAAFLTSINYVFYYLRVEEFDSNISQWKTLFDLKYCYLNRYSFSLSLKRSSLCHL